MTGILIIDDEAGIRRTLASILEDENYRVFTAEDAILGLHMLEKERIDLVFLDVLLPKMGGMEALEKIRRERPGIEVIVISGHANVDMAVRAVKLGAFDFLEKPLSLDKVLTVCRNVVTLQKLREENRTLKKKNRPQGDELVGTSAPITQVRSLIRQAAASDARILVIGENGTGKGLVARAIHQESSRWEGPFVEVNCAAIPETLIESELFGHEKGAFTDAVSGRRGRFEMAHGGTLFLDEIGDMSLSAQAKVLRAIQEQKIERLGGEKTIDTDVRIVTATHRDLQKECKEGHFRQDLFFRLNVIPIRVPPLRERPEDVPLLLFHFLKTLNAKTDFDEEALQFLRTYPWPGNVRELRNLAERIAVMYQGDRISGGVLEGFLQTTSAARRQAGFGDRGGGQGGGVSPGTESLFRRVLDLGFNEAKNSFEKYYLEFQLSKNCGIISKTAEAIGIYPSNLHAKIRKHGISAGTGGNQAGGGTDSGENMKEK